VESPGKVIHRPRRPPRLLCAQRGRAAGDACTHRRCCPTPAQSQPCGRGLRHRAPGLPRRAPHHAQDRRRCGATPPRVQAPGDRQPRLGLCARWCRRPRALCSCCDRCRLTPLRVQAPGAGQHGVGLCNSRVSRAPSLRGDRRGGDAAPGHLQDPGAGQHGVGVCHSRHPGPAPLRRLRPPGPTPPLGVSTAGNRKHGLGLCNRWCPRARPLRAGDAVRHGARGRVQRPGAHQCGVGHRQAPRDPHAPRGRGLQRDRR